jgi:hypothetical protein
VNLRADQAEFFARRLEARVVVAPLTAGVLDAARVGEGVRSLVPEGREDLVGAAPESLAAHEELGQAAGVDRVVGNPALGREVAELEGAGWHTDAASPECDDDRGHLRVPALDRRPGNFQCRHEVTGFHLR